MKALEEAGRPHASPPPRRPPAPRPGPCGGCRLGQPGGGQPASPWRGALTSFCGLARPQCPRRSPASLPAPSLQVSWPECCQGALRVLHSHPLHSEAWGRELSEHTPTPVQVHSLRDHASSGECRPSRTSPQGSAHPCPPPLPAWPLQTPRQPGPHPGSAWGSGVTFPRPTLRRLHPTRGPGTQELGERLGRTQPLSLSGLGPAQLAPAWHGVGGAGSARALATRGLGTQQAAPVTPRAHGEWPRRLPRL